jgi:TonB family protein
MNQTSKLPGKTLGNFAFAGSLFLHVGLIAVFSSWQWDPMIPEKDPLKVVQVKFIYAPSAPQSTETQNSHKRKSVQPVQPKTTPPHSKSRLASRTPSISAPAQLPVKMARKMTQSKIKSIKHPMAKPIIFENTKLTPQMARQMTRSQSKSIMHALTQPTAFTNAPLLTAITPTNSSRHNQRTVVHHRPPAWEVRTSKIPNTPAQAAIVNASTTPASNKIHPLPISAKPLPFIQSNFVPEAVVESPSANITGIEKFSALPRKLPKNQSTDRDSVDADLTGLRGLFTGKVRQRIANAKYYPRIARRRGMEGQPIIAFTLDKEGRLVKAALSQTSGYQLLDEAALDAVQQGAPYPEIPAPLKMESFQFKLPISFILK